MADEPIEKQTIPPSGYSLSIIDTWKLKLPSVYLALPAEFINHVGGIVIAWGMFDKAFEDFLTAILAHTGSIYKGWQFFSFEQRRGIFETEFPLCFSNAPTVMTLLSALIADSYPLQIKRNVLVHGSITLQINPERPLLIAIGEHKKQPVTETFTTDQIDDLYYAILHLAGRMAQFVRPEMVGFVPPLPSHEISLLQDVLSKNPTPRSIVSMISGLPRPSQA
jgi:hypothetical protein